MEINFENMLENLNETIKNLEILSDKMKRSLYLTDIVENKEKVKLLKKCIENSTFLDFLKEQQIQYLIIYELNELNNLYKKGVESYSEYEIKEVLEGRTSRNIDLNVFLNSLISEISKTEADKCENELYKLNNFNEKLRNIFDKNITLFDMETILRSIITKEQSTIIVGQNGAGKSELLKKLRETKLQNCFVIPANKNLFIINFFCFF